MISLLVPSRGRPYGAYRLFSSAVTETAYRPADVEVLFYLDDNDPARGEYQELLGQTPSVGFVGGRIVLSECWNYLQRRATGPIFGHMGDDVVFQTDGWDEMIREEFDACPDRILFVHGRDGIHDGGLGTHGFLHAEWIRAVGYFVPPIFSCDYNDTWLTEVADRIGRRRYLPDLLTEHMHPTAEKGEWDATHAERVARGAADRVEDLYKQSLDRRILDAERLRRVMT